MIDSMTDYVIDLLNDSLSVLLTNSMIDSMIARPAGWRGAVSSHEGAAGQGRGARARQDVTIGFY